MKAIKRTTPLTDIVAYLKESARVDGLRGVTSDTDDRTVSPGHDRRGVPDIVSGTDNITGHELSTQGRTGIEPSTDVLMALVNELVTNVYASENSN